MKQSCIMLKRGRGLDALFAFRLLTAFLLCGVTSVSAIANTPVDDVFLQCDGEVRTRQLAFQLGEQEIEEFTPARRLLQIEIRSARRARIMDHTSGDVLFTPRQCKLSDLKIACEHDDDEASANCSSHAPAAMRFSRDIASQGTRSPIWSWSIMCV